MRWNEIFNEDIGIAATGKSFILDLLAPLKSQGVNSITVQQIIDQLLTNPELDGINLDADFVMSALRGQSKIRIERDPENGAMTVFMDDAGKSRQVDDKQAEQERKNIRQAAVRQATKDDK